MFYRRKFYIVTADFIEEFNNHFNQTNLPNQLKHGTRLVGRWMKQQNDNTYEVFAIWQYNSYEEYIKIESNIKKDTEHLQRIEEWYAKNGGREQMSKYNLEVRNEEIVSTLKESSYVQE
ncbi:MAG TPA: NIPSNAP family protein [Ureibacillus sp.]|nr:NIPSNAP family protein [Ureibacillus sp.]